MRHTRELCLGVTLVHDARQLAAPLGTARCRRVQYATRLVGGARAGKLQPRAHAAESTRVHPSVARAVSTRVWSGKLDVAALLLRTQ